MQTPRTVRALGLALAWLVLAAAAVACAPVQPGALAGTASFEAPYWAPLSSSRQLVLVIAPGWDSPQGVLFRFERRDTRQGWRAAGRPGKGGAGGQAVLVALGGHGLAWGRGLHGDVPENILAPGQPGSQPGGPVKQEGDGRSPAGAFRLGPAFGDKRLGLAMRQLVTTPDLRCVDDPASRAYNMIVDVRDDLVGGPDWSSAERMLRSDGQYSLGVVVGHNDGIPLPGAGSCIFLHVRAAPDPSRTPGTAGCTAMDPKDMDTVARWLDPAANPVLVQLPQAEYERFKGLWGLP